MPDIIATTSAVGCALIMGSGANVQIADSLTPVTGYVVHMFDESKLAQLLWLEDDWDHEGAPRPSLEAVQRAMKIARWAVENGFVITDVDPDVLGGVGL